MPGLSNYPPGVTGSEPQITGKGSEEQPEVEPEIPKLYIRCNNCGEVFDALELVFDHVVVNTNELCCSNELSIVTEEEAF